MERWNIVDPLLTEKVLAALRNEAFPFLSSAQTMRMAAQAALQFASARNPFPQQANAYLLARCGAVSEAVASLNTLLSSLSSASPKIEWPETMAMRARYLMSLLLDSPVQAKAQLETWEAETTRNLGLETLSK
jgi:hypothetical protein